MGAWSVGMQGNDTALDAIAAAGLSCGEPKREKKTLANLRGGKKTVASLFTKEARWCLKEPQGILGLAEYLFDQGFDLSPVMDRIQKALKQQLTKDELETWSSSSERKSALVRFRDRLQGKDVPQELIERDNEGLFSKMAKIMESR